ncbi:Gfo/Idh/MocA family protein [Catelliglobosispora koreensis]|uniref:Gfo/Idh/MocA family protein n=1 Tax=Catelliglobosispora koreensis TaxID=129052 RepID=UPI00037E0F2C|nr:Gfo/Idh/MocA family oxidoreductase [Catelliglobosispora koreensis]
MTGGFAQIGFGYWGPNLARNLGTLAGPRWRYLVDLSPERREKAASLYPQVNVTDDLDAVLADDQVSAVIVATPAASHAPLARRALAAGKHVFVEKPLALSTEDAVELARTADEKGVTLMVGHTFEFNPAVRAMKEYIDSGEIGEVLYLHSQRLNLGRIQSDINAFWSIGPHDVSIANYLLGSSPQWVSARGARYLNDTVDDVMFVTASYPGGVLVHMHVSWLDPSKTRRTTVVGSKKMLVYDDMDQDGRLKIFDKGADRLDPDAYGAYQYRLRDGAMHVPSLPMVEPLSTELRHFIECVDTGRRPDVDGWNGARTVAVLEAVDRSLHADGARIDIGTVQ